MFFIVCFEIFNVSQQRPQTLQKWWKKNCTFRFLFNNVTLILPIFTHFSILITEEGFPARKKNEIKRSAAQKLPPCPPALTRRSHYSELESITCSGLLIYSSNCSHTLVLLRVSCLTSPPDCHIENSENRAQTNEAIIFILCVRWKNVGKPVFNYITLRLGMF